MVTDFLAAQKGRGMKFCVSVQLLSGQVFSHFGELWLAWSHSGGITSGTSYIEVAVEQSELGAVAWWACKAVWWDLCLASLLTHLFKLKCRPVQEHRHRYKSYIFTERAALTHCPMLTQDTLMCFQTMKTGSNRHSIT